MRRLWRRRPRPRIGIAPGIRRWVRPRRGRRGILVSKPHGGSEVQGRVHTVGVTSASVHDSQMLDECLHGDEQGLYGDKAYGDAQRQQDAQEEGVEWRVLRKAKRGKKLNCADHSFNRKSNRTRARVEHPFGIIKHLWGYRKVRYRGLAKNAAQLFTLFALANVSLARRELRATSAILATKPNG